MAWAVPALSLLAFVGACGKSDEAPSASESVNEWTWVSGSNIGWQAGVYGTLGTAAQSNMPGSRNGALSWVDASGKFWLFGGGGCDGVGDPGYLNDLWKYDPTANEWTWVSGSDAVFRPGIYGTKGAADPSNCPGSRVGAASWIDAGGNLWLFGGEGLDSGGNQGYINDLWKFDPLAREWTWVGGAETLFQAGVYGTRGTPAPSNFPGARTGAASWSDAAGKFWLFGGEGIDAVGGWSTLNDVWKFDPSTLQWTWVTGSNLAYPASVYGAKGIGSPSNTPGGRATAARVDAGGRVWIFGGFGVDWRDFPGDLNDLWTFDPASLEWTWVSGSDKAYQVGIYGTKGTPDAANVPGTRALHAFWLVPSDSLWVFGGDGYSSWSYDANLNDLWKYDLKTHIWTWISGADTELQTGVYGTKGVRSAANVPGARSGAAAWLDSSGRLWLFGGYGVDSTGMMTDLNDLWRYER